MPNRTEPRSTLERYIRDDSVVFRLLPSGTEALWQSFCCVHRFAACDEPFHPRLSKGGLDNRKYSWTELAGFLSAPVSLPVEIDPEAKLSSSPELVHFASMPNLCIAAVRVTTGLMRDWYLLPGRYRDLQILTMPLTRDQASSVKTHPMPTGRCTTCKTLEDAFGAPLLAGRASC